MKTLKQLKAQALADTLAEAKAATAGQTAVDKRVTLFHSKDASGSKGAAAGPGSIGGLKTPTPEQLARINRFTLSPKTADELAVFETLSANSLPDRDDDVFTPETIAQFAALPEPYGSVGKSYMTGHDYNNMPVGRIFGVGTRTDVTDSEGKVIDATFLTNEVYVPRTAANTELIDAMDFGVNWAVSVGVMLDAMNCSICDKTMHSFFGMGMCEDGHFKGSYYDRSGETDSQGYPMERLPTDAGAVKALGKMEGAKDFYELSQVFLGAQFYASLGKGAGLENVIKAASASKAPLVGLKSAEADIFNMPHTPDAVRAALAAPLSSREEDGTIKWSDSNGLAWTFGPGDIEPLCLGKSAQKAAEDDLDDNAEDEDDTTEEVNTDGEEGDGEQPLSEGGGLGSEQQEQRGAGDEGVGEGTVESDADGEGDGDSVAGQVAASAEASEGDEDTSSEDDDGSEKENKSVSRKTVIDAAKAAGAPHEWIAAMAEDSGNGLTALLTVAATSNSLLVKQVSDLTPKAAIGDDYLQSLQADAIDWYVKSHTDGSDRGVDVAPFQKILEACGDNVELVKTLIDENKNLARAKFPRAVRRSSAQSDPHDKRVEPITDGVEQHTKASNTRVRRLHG